MPDLMPSVDPALAQAEQDVEIANLLYTGLVRLNAAYRVVPAAAYRWTIGKDHQTYTFYLRKGMRFSNGDPLTASDFAYSITRSLNPALRSTSAPTYLLDIQGAGAVLAGKSTTLSGVKVLSSDRLQIKSRWPLPSFLKELAYPTSYALDKKRLEKLNSPTDTSWYSNPVSSGPYTIKSWNPNGNMVLVPNPNYWGAPAETKIVISFTPVPSHKQYTFVKSHFDLAQLNAEHWRLARLAGVRKTSALTVDGIYMNLNKKPFSSVEVRRALTLAIPRNRVVQDTFGPTAIPFTGSVPSGEIGYDSKLKPLTYSPKSARAALAAAHLGTGKHFPAIVLYYPTDSTDTAMSGKLAALAGAIVKAWDTNLGINASARPLAANVLLTDVQSNSIPLYLLGWSANYPDPRDWLTGQWRSDAVNNNVHFMSTTFDKLVKAADVTWNFKRRMSLYNQAQQVLVQDAAWIPLYIPYRLEYISPSVSNLVLTGYGIMPRSGNWSSVQVTEPAKSRHNS